MLVAAPVGLRAAPDENAGREAGQSGAAAPAREVDPSPLLRDALDVRRRANQASRAAQKRIDALSDETDELYARANAAETQIAALLTYNRSMREVVAEQEEELGSLGSQLVHIDEVGRSVTPLMERMIATLESFVALDLPFLVDERADRIAGLRRLMLRADVPVSEKYRLIMEAYRIEADYGRTIEAYRGRLGPDAGDRTVDFLRFGRIALVYLTLDGSEAGMWDAGSRSWRVLPASFVGEVLRGLRVARKQIAPDLVNLPLPAPEQGELESDGGRG